MRNHNKGLAIGLDGATFGLIQPWVEKGSFPNLAKLMEKGVHGDPLGFTP